MDELISAEAVVCTLILMGATQAAFSAFSMFRQRHYFLAAWLGCFSMEIASKGLLYLRIAPEWTQWLGYWFSFDIVYGPLLLLWVLRLINTGPLSKWHLLHFVPTLLYLYLTIPEALSMSAELRMERINNYRDLGEWVSYSEETMSMLSGLLWHPYGYVFVALGCLIWRRKQIPTRTYHWLLSMLLLHIGMWCAVVFGMVFVPWPLPLVFLASYLPAVFWVNLLAWISLSYLQLSRPGADNDQTIAPENNRLNVNSPSDATPPEQPAQSNEPREKYQHTRLDKVQQAQIASQLETLMEQGAYTQSRLSLADVASLIDIAPHYVSQVINDHYQCNFADFVNRYRLKSVKNQLRSSKLQQSTILEIALENGFNSKTTFNAVFKKDTGMTPSQFRRQKVTEKCETD